MKMRFSTTTGILLIALLCASCGGDSSPIDADGFASTDTVYNLTTAVDELSTIGCLTDPGVKSSLEGEIGTDETAFQSTVSGASGAGLCATGAQLLTSLASSSATPYFEESQILFDSGTDGCVESVFAKSDFTITSNDADGDGCYDYLWDFTDVMESLQAAVPAISSGGFKSPPVGEPMFLTDDIITTLQYSTESVLRYLYPPSEEVQAQIENYSFDSYRAGALPQLESLIQSVRSVVNDQATLQILVNFLNNTSFFVQGFEGCSFTGSAFDSQGDIIASASSFIKDGATITMLFCIYVNDGHGWLSLKKDDEEHVRGFYKSTRGDKQTAGSVPLSKGDSDCGGSCDKPKKWLSGIESPNGSGYITEMDKGKAGYKICWTITATEWDTIANAINADITNTPTYRYFSENCLGWAIKVAGLIGKKLPSYTYCGTPHPPTLTQTLKDMVKNGEKPPGSDRVEEVLPKS